MVICDARTVGEGELTGHEGLQRAIVDALAPAGAHQDRGGAVVCQPLELPQHHVLRGRGRQGGRHARQIEGWQGRFFIQKGEAPSESLLRRFARLPREDVGAKMREGVRREGVSWVITLQSYSVAHLSRMWPPSRTPFTTDSSVAGTRSGSIQSMPPGGSITGHASECS